ncbi:hypothetical protein LAD12857_07500 [Lacrimispora amygdalina]|uniref:Lipoprotein n=1 Tax=Lacrimispora amygdalina TaxID=253257 RepID=A0A3E2NGT0_9FIRM|nr:hypothetical protein [Clostridium indicum]RFZ80110.1 hypothetical protein DS742_04820 [Clostridium indicum]
MKRTLMIALAVCAAVLLPACGRSTKQAESAAGTVTETGKETSSVSGTSPAASTQAPGSTAEFKILTGKVTEVADNMESMTVTAGDTKAAFHLDNAVVETSYSLEPDVDVSIIYKGEISGSDTTNAKVILVLDAQDKMEVKEVTGSVKDQAMSTFTIDTGSGKEMGFIKDNCEGLETGVLGNATDDSNGSGALVKVTYVTVTYDAGSESNFPLKVEAAK